MTENSLDVNPKLKTRRYFRRDAKKYFNRTIKPSTNGFFRHPKVIDDLPLDGNTHSLYIRMISSAGYMTNNYGEVTGTLDYWAERQGVSVKVIRTCLKKLTEIGLIHQVGDTRNAKRYVVNYGLFREGEFSQEKVNEAFKSLGRIKSENGQNNYHGKPASLDTLSVSVLEQGQNVLQNRAEKNAESGLNTNPAGSELISYELNNNNIDNLKPEDNHTLTDDDSHKVSNERIDYHSLPKAWIDDPLYAIPGNAVIYQGQGIVRQPYTTEAVSDIQRNKQLRWLRAQDNYRRIVSDMFDAFAQEYPIDTDYNPFDVTRPFNLFSGNVSRGRITASDYASAWYDYCYTFIRDYAFKYYRGDKEPTFRIVEQAMAASRGDAFALFISEYSFNWVTKPPSILNYPLPDKLSAVGDMLNLYFSYLHIFDRIYFEPATCVGLTLKSVRELFVKYADDPDWGGIVRSRFRTTLIKIHPLFGQVGFSEVGQSHLPFPLFNALPVASIENLLLHVFDEAIISTTPDDTITSITVDKVMAQFNYREVTTNG